MFFYFLFIKNNWKVHAFSLSDNWKCLSCNYLKDKQLKAHKPNNCFWVWEKEKKIQRKSTVNPSPLGRLLPEMHPPLTLRWSLLIPFSSILKHFCSILRNRASKIRSICFLCSSKSKYPSSDSMAVWRIITQSYLKYASIQLTRNYSQVCLATSLTHVVKQTKLSSFDIPHSDISRKSSKLFENVRLFATSAQVHSFIFFSTVSAF